MNEPCNFGQNISVLEHTLLSEEIIAKVKKKYRHMSSSGPVRITLGIVITETEMAF